MWMLCVWWVLLGTLGAGSAQLVLDSIPFLEIKHCNGREIILPCVVTNLKEHNSLSMFVKWQFQGNQFFLYDGVTDNITKNNSFDTATFLNRSMVPYGIVSLVISTKQALLGNYTCEVTEVNREGRTKFELRESSGSSRPQVYYRRLPDPTWKGPASLITWGRGYAAIDDHGEIIWTPARCVRPYMAQRIPPQPGI